MKADNLTKRVNKLIIEVSNFFNPEEGKSFPVLKLLDKVESTMQNIGRAGKEALAEFNIIFLLSNILHLRFTTGS